MINEFFPQRPESHPMIYAYSDSNPQYKGLLKVGYTEKDVERRVGQHIVLDVLPGIHTKRPDGLVPYKIVLAESAMRNDITCFTDHDVHHLLRKKRVYEAGDE